MVYEQEVKELAYTLDPIAWVSYSGMSIEAKRALEPRRVASLNKAQRIWDRTNKWRNNSLMEDQKITFDPAIDALSWREKMTIRILLSVATLITPSAWTAEVKNLVTHLNVHLPEKK